MFHYIALPNLPAGLKCDLPLDALNAIIYHGFRSGVLVPNPSSMKAFCVISFISFTNTGSSQWALNASKPAPPPPPTASIIWGKPTVTAFLYKVEMNKACHQTSLFYSILKQIDDQKTALYIDGFESQTSVPYSRLFGPVLKSLNVSADDFQAFAQYYISLKEESLKDGALRQELVRQYLKISGRLQRRIGDERYSTLKNHAGILKRVVLNLMNVQMRTRVIAFTPQLLDLLLEGVDLTLLKKQVQLIDAMKQRVASIVDAMRA
jgi:hypothetical protein